MPLAAASAPAATMRRARSISAGVGMKVSFAMAIWLGWMQVLPEKPWRRAASHSAR
jgi:hypothetical protein